MTCHGLARPNTSIGLLQVHWANLQTLCRWRSMIYPGSCAPRPQSD